MQYSRQLSAVAGAVLALLALAPNVASAQDAAIEGRVTDMTGLVLPGVTVDVRHATGGQVRTVSTDDAGTFAITALQPGTYDVTFALPGFTTVVRDDVAIRAGATATLAVTLSVQFQQQVVVVGSRAQPRSVTESPVPIDAIPFQDVVRQGATTLDYQLRTLVPSFNVATHPISDAATLVRPASLRNLAHDHTLVLVNGKRRHRSSVITWINGASDGAQGPDISTIPAIALRQVEVLRDGASAQYGSDAIAGVLNFLLKDARAGGSLEFTTGTYRAGDGDAYTVAGNAGLPLGATGFANLSLEYGNTDPTDRSVQRTDAAGLIAAGNTAVADPAQIWGNPTIEDDLKLFGNFGHLFASGFQVYGHANYADKTVTEGFYFRNPNTRANIYSLDSGETLLIGDVLAANGLGSATCPTVAITGNVPDQAALAQVFADPNCFSFQEIAPGGFTPRFGGNVTDMSAVAGLRRLVANGLTWDASASYGAHQSDFFFQNTVNTPRSAPTLRATSTRVCTGRRRSISTSTSPMPPPRWSTSRAAPNGATSASRWGRAGGRRGRWVRTPRRASSPRPTGFPDSPTIRPGPGPAATWRCTATLNCVDPTTGGRSGAPSGSSASTSSAPRRTASCRPGTGSATPSRCGAV